MRYSSIFNAARETKSQAECAALIRKAEAHARHAQDWCLCASAWLECMNDADSGARCLLEAESRFHGNCRELAICAGEWLRLLHNPEAARRCVAKIVGTASNAEDWDYCADFMVNAGGQELAALCLAQAEKYARTKQDWLERADMWRDLLKNEVESARCRGEAEADFPIRP